jgi:CheY-like chemotaxis protein
MVCKFVRLDGVRVLFVDDRADDRELFRLVFRRCGAEVAVAQSAVEALALFERLDPHVLVSDISLMADVDGYDLIRAIRARGSKIPAVAFTGRARDRDRRAAYQAGFHAHISKPAAPSALVAKVADLVRATSNPAADS